MFTEQQTKWLQRVEDLFLRFGVKSITMDDVARELGISKKTLYQFVESKDDLVMKVIDLHIEQDIAECAHLFAGAQDALEEIFTMSDFVRADLDRMKSNVMFDLQRYHNEAWTRMEAHQRLFIVDMMQKNLVRGIREGLYRSELPVEITARLHAAQSFSMFNEHLFPRQQFPMSVTFKEYIILFLYSVVSDKGRALLHLRLKQQTEQPSSVNQ